MFEINEQWFLPVNFIILLLFIFKFMAGYKKGFLRMIVSLFFMILSYFASWILCGVLGQYIRIWPEKWNIMEETMFSVPANRFLNEVCWFILLLVFFRIISAVIDHMIRALQKVPVIHEVSALAGGAFGLVESVIYVLVFSLLLRTPVFNGGQTLIDGTLISQINQVTAAAFEKFSVPVIDADAFRQIFEDASKLTEEQKNALEEWLKERGYEELSSYEDLEL